MDPDDTIRDGTTSCNQLTLDDAIKLVDRDMGGVGDAAAVVLAEMRRLQRAEAALKAELAKRPEPAA